MIVNDYSRLLFMIIVVVYPPNSCLLYVTGNPHTSSSLLPWLGSANLYSGIATPRQHNIPWWENRCWTGSSGAEQIWLPWYIKWSGRHRLLWPEGGELGHLLKVCLCVCVCVCFCEGHSGATIDPKHKRMRPKETSGHLNDVANPWVTAVDWVGGQNYNTQGAKHYNITDTGYERFDVHEFENALHQPCPT